MISGKNELEIVLFNIDNRDYAINVSKVKEILNFLPYTQIPLSPPTILGMIRSRGEVIPLISLRKYLNKPDFKKKDGKIIITDFFNMNIGFLVDSVKKLLRIKWDNIQPPVEFEESSVLIGVIKHENNIIYMIDFERIVLELNTFITMKEEKNIIKGYENKNICVAEDSKSMRKLIEKHLKNIGFNKIIGFSNGKETLDYFLEFTKEKTKNETEKLPDILITDIEMPLMDGYTLVKNLRETGIYNDLPIIIFSSISTPELQFKKDIIGADAYITKYNLDKLDNIINVLLLKKHIQN